MDSGDLNSAEKLNIFNDEDSQPLFEGARVTTGAVMLLPALFTSKHRISGDGIQQLLQIVSLILPSTHNFSVSLQAFRDFFKHLKNPLKKHYYCPSCSGYIENPMGTTCLQERIQREGSIFFGDSSYRTNTQQIPTKWIL